MIIVAGNSRSGTTMMGRILGNHPSVFTFEELHFFDELTDPEKLFLETDQAALHNLCSRLYSVQREGYFNRTSGKSFAAEAATLVSKAGCRTPADVYEAFLNSESQQHHKSVPCEQTPQNIFALKDLLRIFPHARVVLMIRDPREVLLSQKNKWKRRQFSGNKIPFSESLRARINYHPVTISKIWNAAATEISIWENDPRVLVVRFEDLLSQSHQTITSICDHCNLIFHEEMLRIPAVGSSHVADKGSQVTGIDSSRTGKWNTGLTKTEVSLCQEINGYEMIRWGYTPESANVSALHLFISRITMPFKLALAIPFNLHRLRNPGKLFRRLF